jgi:hypothetical protein
MLWRLQFEDGTHFDLPLGTSMIGRSETCAICVPHPSVSREHLRVHVDDHEVAIEDVGSRNGTWVARSRLRGTTRIHAPAELRVGDVELVLATVTNGSAPSRPKLRVRCSGCGGPLEAGACPRCARLDTAPPRVRSGNVIDTPAILIERQRWFVDLHVDLVQRALATGHLDEAESTLKRIADDPEVLAGASAARWEALLRCAVSLAIARNDGRWLRWVFERLGGSFEPPESVVHALELLPPSLLGTVLPAFERLLEVLQTRGNTLSGAVRDSVPPLSILAERARSLSSPPAPP